MVWETQASTTTTADDGKTAAVLTFFFYRRLLSHVPRDIDNLPRALQQLFLRFFCVFLFFSYVPSGNHFFSVESRLTIGTPSVFTTTCFWQIFIFREFYHYFCVSTKSIEK